LRNFAKNQDSWQESKNGKIQAGEKEGAEEPKKKEEVARTEIPKGLINAEPKLLSLTSRIGPYASMISLQERRGLDQLVQ
jgi:hypothetical protein